MTNLTGRTLFLTTSPRTPAKMVPEISLLHSHFAGQRWNAATQAAFMDLLREENFFNGEGANDPAFSARDRINRAPKALGFVTLTPAVALTPAGGALVTARRTEEIFLRQMLKFQLPSPYHNQGDSAAEFFVKPYLEIFRLIRHFGSLKFDELQLFALQLVDYRDFDKIIGKIDRFRAAKAQHQGSYKTFYALYTQKELVEVYKEEIASGQTTVRGSRDHSTENFLQTKARNLRDYADACVRYLRATGMLNISQVGKSLSIAAEKLAEVDYFLKHTDRRPCFVDDENAYVAYLGSAATPALLTDDRKLLEQKLASEFPEIPLAGDFTLEQVKDLLNHKIEQRKQHLLARQVSAIKAHESFEEITKTFEQIRSKAVLDAPLMLEWNVWRAMTMLNGGAIQANLKFDDFGAPMSTAQGNMPDIVCDYGEFAVTVEVTLQSGQRQYETEGESVTRHLAKYKKLANKPAYCLFIAPAIHSACIAHFYALHLIKIEHYGGYSAIVPLPLDAFIRMLRNAHGAPQRPQARHVRRFFERSGELALLADSEQDWHQAVVQEALSWQTAPA